MTDRMNDMPAAKPPVRKRGLIIAGSVLGCIVLVSMLSNHSGNDDQTSTTSTITRTVTVTPRPSTVTLTASPVTITEAAPAPFFQPPAEPTDEPLAPPIIDAPALPPVNVAPLPSSVYYRNCAAARAAGAAPLRVGDPGYRSGLDGDDDGVACE